MLGFHHAPQMAINTNFASTDIKKLYKYSWFPICQEKDVLNKKVYNIDLIDSSVSVIRISDGKYSVFDDRCPHRGAKLSGGTVENDCVVCPYHGMEFDCQTSEVVSFMASADVKHVKGSLQIYKNKVYDNIIWAYLGSGKEPKFHANELETTILDNDIDFVSIYGHCDINCDIFSAVENLIDFCHINVVHSFGNNIDPSPIIDTVNFPEDRGVHFFYKTGAKSLANFLDNTEKDTVSVYNSFREPCSVMSRVTFGDEMIKSVRVHFLPIGEKKTRLFWGLHRNFLTAYVLDQAFEYFMLQTLAEDKFILENMYSPGVPVKQILTEYDWLIVQYRKRMAEHMCTK